ncbi:helix-turn-helix transcriptional regulator [Corynebacterium flavescens]|uniref:helix-turn-helix transcriptional regulator n=1 Tax=Corynebacterium flavescens TaxID=28028 RepID=UPI003FD0D555
MPVPECLNKPTLSARECAEILGCAHSSVFNAIKSGTFPFPVIHIGGRVMIPSAPVRTALGLDTPEAAR